MLKMDLCFFGGRGSSYGSAVSIKLKSIENSIANAKKENLYVIDKNGNILLSSKGDEHHIYDIDEKALKDNTVTHNHPKGNNPNLSIRDMEQFVKTGMKELRVVSDDYVISLKHDKKSRGKYWSPNTFTAVYRANEQRIHDEIRKGVQEVVKDWKAGKYKTRDAAIKAQLDVNFKIMFSEIQKIAKKTGYSYTYKKRK